MEGNIVVLLMGAGAARQQRLSSVTPPTGRTLEKVWA